MRKLIYYWILIKVINHNEEANLFLDSSKSDQLSLFLC